jgi:hypothetical protein
VTLSVLALAVNGCAISVGPVDTTVTDAPTQVEASVTVSPDVASPPDVAITEDAPIAEDAAVADASTDAGEAGEDCTPLQGMGTAYSECCRRNGWNWDLGCAAWGPFMPPEMGV